ncbi:hypothetical protein [Kangiella koreensis]|uniref:Uncharacterized protein n=1 Tax=Kangiella koreensis (strain DSM 16069 / JCM 12317 / KCTC 12182 / SW-125) TaxID=523791 RepID=C7R9E7_KANKD|nr:hypothetical protein [Kangiella koreensis]ACV26038.1 hypothetical protein Kkor_0618 [Kangiella koreensis DSM 16069]
MQNVSKLEVAEEQLDWAIRLLLDHNAPAPAITLAGAAEELFGRPLKAEAAFRIVMETVPKKLHMDPKTYSQKHLNYTRNWLKHWGDKEDGHADIDLYAEAVTLILRALANYIPNTKALSNEALRFTKWLPKYFQSA